MGQLTVVTVKQQLPTKLQTYLITTVIKTPVQVCRSFKRQTFWLIKAEQAQVGNNFTFFTCRKLCVVKYLQVAFKGRKNLTNSNVMEGTLLELMQN